MAQDPDLKAILTHYLGVQRAVMLDKLEGLTERQARTPITSTGTNILGVIKHAVGVEAGYLGECFGRPSPVELPWYRDGAEDNEDMWATAEQDIPWIRNFCARVWAHSDQVLAELDLDAPGTVSWWRDPDVTLGRVLVHVVAEYARHAGHIDIARELIDGRVGWLSDSPVMPEQDEQWWADYVARLRELADSFPETSRA